MSDIKQGYYNEANTEDGTTIRTSPSVGSGFSQVGLKKEDDLTNSTKDVTGEEGKLHLQRRVGLISGTALIVGTMIGSGIFVSPKGLLQRTGSVGLSLLVWGACGALSMLGALCYAELGTLIPKSGAEYQYFRNAFGPKLKPLQDIPAFLYCWTSVLVLKPSSMAIISLSTAEYAVRPFFSNCESPDLALKLLAASTVCVITFINCYSVKMATSIQNIFTAAKLLAVLIIVVGGLVKLGEGNTQYLATGFEGSTTSFGDIATAFYNGLWAYDGWNNLNYVTEEIINPYVNLPRSIILGIPLVTVCYILVNIAYLTVMSPEELLASEAVAVTFGGRVLGILSWCIPLFVACSTFGAANGSCFTGGRLCYVAAREGHLVDILSYVHAKRFTPSPALIFNAVIALLMIIPGNIGSLIDFFSFTAWIFYGGAMLALIVMRWTQRDLPRPYKVNIIIPIIVFIISCYLVVAPIVDNPQMEYLYATLFILAGLIFYVPFVHFKIELKIMRKITVFFQLLLEVAPSDEQPPD